MKQLFASYEGLFGRHMASVRRLARTCPTSLHRPRTWRSWRRQRLTPHAAAKVLHGPPCQDPEASGGEHEDQRRQTCRKQLPSRSDASTAVRGPFPKPRGNKSIMWQVTEDISGSIICSHAFGCLWFGERPATGSGRL